MEFTQLIAQRYSCKNFGAGKVDAAALHTILEAGRWHPPPRTPRNSTSTSFSPKKGWQRSMLPLPAATVPPSVWWSPMTRTTPLLTPANG